MARTIILVRNTPSGSSVFPDTWDSTQEGNSGWFTLYPNGREAEPGTYLHVCEMAVSGTRTAFVACAPNQIMAGALTAFASASSQAWTLAELRADNGVLATRLKEVWRDTVSGSIQFNATMAGFFYDTMLANEE